MLCVQVAIVQMGGRAFSTVPLSGSQWAVCIGFGALTLLARQALRAIPTEPPPPGGPPGPGTAAGSSGSSRGSSAGSRALGAASAAVGWSLQTVRDLFDGAAAAAARTVQRVPAAAYESSWQAGQEVAVTVATSSSSAGRTLPRGELWRRRQQLQRRH
jgi:hypothetical protein